jgi:hypothetical protein
MFIWWDWNLNSDLQACKSKLVPHLYFALVILEMGSVKLFAQVALNYDPPDLILPSS